MSELADVSGGQTITSSFTNQVKERSAMRYSSAAARDTSIPAPIAGSLAYLQDSDTVTMYDGTVWVTLTDVTTTDATYLKLTEPAQTLTGDLAMAGELSIVETGQFLSSQLVRNVFITDIEPSFAISGSLWLDEPANRLYFSDGAQWVLAIQGV